MNKISLLVVATIGLATPHLSRADIVHLDKVIITSSLCVGNDCVNGESFGFDTIRLKENNLRIKFDDTSNSASFANNDWQITINDTTNGGANKFSIDDITGGRTPFTIEASAPSHSLYVDDGGRIGLGTSTPVTQLHIKDGNTPTVRLEQDGTSGFTPQTWDVAGNEAGFFVRDATNGSRLVFRILPGAPAQSLNIEGSGDVGIGTLNPEGSLHVLRAGTTPASVVLEQTAAGVQWEIKANAGTGRLTFKDLNGSTTPFKFQPTAAENLFRVGILANNMVDINGDLKVTGDLTVDGQCEEVDGACADYVFEPGYNLKSLQTVENFIQVNGHLPNVPSAKDMMENGVNLAQMSGRLLEKVEELTLYTLQQEKSIAQMNQETAQLENSVLILTQRLLQLEQAK